MTDQPWGRDQMMALAAVRYCVRRQTYIVADCVEWILGHWDSFTENTRAVIERDIEAAFARDDEDRRAKRRGESFLGSDFDRAEWEKVRKLWEGA